MAAYDYALNLLTARAYTTRNIRRKLLQKEFDSADVEAAIDRLLANGLLDDKRFSTEYARQQLTYGGKSTRRVQQDLARKGVAVEHIRAALERVHEEEPIDTHMTIARVARKKLLSMGALDDTVKRRRLFAFLARRGFELDDIKRAIATSFPSR